MMTITTHSPLETERWAEALAAEFKGGEILALCGDLGAGKTVVARGIGKGLQVQDTVISPTFNYILEYKGRLQLFHADLYRIEGKDAFFALGLDEYLDRGGVFVIEWAERVRDVLPPETVWIFLEPGDDPAVRTITVSGGHL
jgi:tRNA threonylcarbamoyladenosine biosynthesis protein TsaE